MNIQEVFVLVPADPIKAIDMGWAYLDAAREAEPNKIHSFSHAGYRAMIAAAPTVDLPAYDEAKERDLFEAFYTERAKTLPLPMGNSPLRYAGGQYINDFALFGWMVWLECAKSRARSAE